jgi:hypothetical protein
LVALPDEAGSPDCRSGDRHDYTTGVDAKHQQGNPDDEA